VFSDDLYYYHPHGISDKAEDSLVDCGPILNRHLVTEVPADATTLVRRRRVGVTIRNLLPRCNHQPLRAEHFLVKAWKTFHHGNGSRASDNEQQPLISLPRAPAASAPSSSGAAVSPPHVQTPSNHHGDNQRHRERASAAERGDATVTSDRQQVSALAHKIDRVEATQEKILQTLKEIQIVLAHNAQNDGAFRQDVGTILDELTGSVMALSGKVEELTQEKPSSP
jgi:alkylated DNA repair protein alkB family protein 6